MKIGILTAGGDCPGINAAIRGVCKTAISTYGMKVLGFSSGYRGLIEKNYQELKEEQLSGILTLGGTILGTSRDKPFQSGSKESVKLIKKNYKDLGLKALVVIGGNGTQKTASQLADEGLNIIGIPKTIDNDVYGTDVSFGFDSAVMIATEAIDRLHTTANSHNRIMVIELMGHHAGWISLYSGVAGGGDVILIPEIPYDIKNISKYLKQRIKEDKKYSIVVVAEGIEKPEGEYAASYISNMVQNEVGIETRKTILGYIQRGGTPSPMDRVLATEFGSHTADLIAQQKFGVMVCKKGNNIESVPLSEVGGKIKLVSPDNPLIEKSRKMGICFGDS